MCIGGYITGICCDPSDPKKKTSVTVPLVGVETRVLLVDYTAEVTIKQRYENVESNPIEAVYNFPLQEKAVVTSFEAEIDGRVVVGKIQEKEQARNTYDDAISAGHGAYLLEESKEKPNIFQASIGNLPPQKDVVITLRYVSELQVTAEKNIQFVLPTTSGFPNAKVGEKFPLPKFPHEKSTVSNDLNVEIFLEMSSPIKSITSDDHKITVEQQSETLSKVVLLNEGLPLSTNLSLDIALVSPHLAAVKVQNSTDGQKVAMISLFPDQTNEDNVVYTEMIFLIDRSGSMEGTKIYNVRSTMELFLRSIPEGTLFNIVGFGSHFQFLFPDGSVEYNDDTLNKANQAIAKLHADFGGTELLQPLQAILKTPSKPGIPRQLFVLTDGQVSNTSACISFVKDYALTTRVFTFGIGNDVDVELVKGLAKAGEGAVELIRDNEIKDIDIKVLTQLKRALKPALTDLQIEWSKDLDVISYSPFTLPPLWGGSRLLLYATLGKNAKSGPFVIRGKAARGDFESKSFIDVDKLTEGNSIVKLAAKSLINDLEENKSYFHKVGFPPGKSAENEIISLSIAHQILSKRTAFVAVEKRDTPTTGTLKIREVDYETLQNEKHYDINQDDDEEIYAESEEERLAPIAYDSISASHLQQFDTKEVYCANMDVYDSISASPLQQFEEKDVYHSIERVDKANANVYAPPPAAKKSSGFSLSSFVGSLFSKKDATPPPPKPAPAPSSAPAPPPPAPSTLSDVSSTSVQKSVTSLAPPPPPSEALAPPPPPPAFYSDEAFAAPPPPVSYASSSSSSVQKKKESGVSSDLRSIIMQQKSAGNFPVDVIKLLHFNTPQTEDSIEKSLPSDLQKIQGVLELFITAIVVQYFLLRCKDSEAYWDLVASKSKTWIGKEIKKQGLDGKFDALAVAADFVKNNL
eukprot:TRINITY_DN2395_c0_g1_i2.p1 TRINITY_DN2395_c0_g1~~TRINITY_DN2395_c0_g1_i2.p1  ORF type:complete len:918 (+),score=260.17 TRINITY_DN2395_c0_g1_i2:845-3598(+)